MIDRKICEISLWEARENYDGKDVREKVSFEFGEEEMVKVTMKEMMNWCEVR